MWGGVDSDGSNATSTAAWGASVGGGSSGDWGNGNSGQTGWASGGGGPNGGKGGSWDSQQSQSNLVASTGTGAQASGSTWQGQPSNVAQVNGWTGSGGGGQPNWSNAGTQQQWPGTSPGSGSSTWAGVASRHAVPNSATPQTPIQQTACSGPVVTTPTVAAVRPKGASNGFENVPGSGGVGWGKPVDQGTPWGGDNSNTNTYGNAPAASAPTGSWGAGGSNGGTNWNAAGGAQNSAGNISRENSWHGQQPDGRDGRGSYAGYNGGKPVRGDGPQWNSEGSGWEAGQQGGRNSSSSGNMWGAAIDTPQQRENVWTGPPPPAEMGDNHMIWTNPYPKKTAQPDKGTTTWGDPTSQGDIKRWKTNNEGDILPALTALQTGTQLGTGAGNGNSGIPQTQQQAWKDPTTPTPQQSSTPSWGSGEVVKTSSSSIPSPTPASGGGWGDQPSVPVQISGVVPAKPATQYDRDGISTAGWGGGKPADPTRNSIESDGGNASDDVFTSNPTTPLTPAPGQPGSTLILSKQLQQMPNGFGHPNSTSSQNINQLVSKFNVQNAQLQSIALTSSTTAGGGREVPQQVLTQQIADQLKAAVRAGLIDIGILHQPLSHETLLRLNQLLQCVPKLEQAQKEMIQLQTHSANQQGTLNPAQQQEYQRIANEVKQLRQTMTSLKQAISAQTQNVNSGQQTQGKNGTSGTNGGGGDGGQSKLEQWKRGTSNGGINGGDILGGGNDPWSNTPAKRNSGTDWPQSPATTPGDMPKSPEKSNDGGKDSDNQQNGDKGNRMSTPVSSSGNENSGGAGTGGLTTPTLLDDVPEFKPGQPWNWRDPKELAEDPDATPGSVKRPALISVNSDFFSGGTSPSSAGHLSAGSDLIGAAALAAGLSAMNFGGNSTNMMGSGGFQGYGGSGMMPSNYYGQKGGFEPTKMSGPGGFGQQGLGDSWPSSGGMPRGSRPPSQMGQPISGRGQFKHSMSTPNTSSAGFMPPYNMGGGASAQWVVLTNLNMIDESSLQLMMSRIAPVASCMVPPGAGFALVKFKDVSLDKVLPRLQQECSAAGLTIQLAKDDEVSRLIQAVTGQRAGGPPGGAGHMFGPPPPPPHHHPGALGPAIWDAPPPQAPGPWGPPPPQAAGLHHHGGGGPFAPPHPSALNDPTVAAATAMSMPMPPGMHDGGLFAPVGHDRHAPF